MSHLPIRILLITHHQNDHQGLRDLLAAPANQTILAGRFQLDWVATYRDGLAAIDSDQHDVYLVDYRLDRHNGLELIKLATEHGCTRPLILLTEQADHQLDIEAIQAGAADHLVKSRIDAYLLDRSIRYAIERQRTAEELQRRNRELALFNHIIAASAAGQTPDGVLETVCRELALAFNVVEAVAFVFNPERTQARVVVRYQLETSHSPVSNVVALAKNPFFKLLLAHKAPLIIADTEQDDRLAAVAEILHLNKVRSFLVAPLVINDEVVGGITFSAQAANSFHTSDINLAWSLADHVASTMERARLSESHQRLITAIEQSDECVIITDIEGIVEYVNPAFERTTGYSRADVIGQPLEEFSNRVQNEAIFKEMFAALQGGSVWRGRLTNRRKDGKSFIEEAVISPVRNEYGVVVNTVLLKRDVTHQVQLEEQLRQSQKMDAIGQLAGGVAHDFNNLLTAIMSYTGLALDSLPANNPVYSDIQGIQKTAERAAGLTRQLLAFARQQIAQPKIIDLNDSILNLNKMLRRLIGADIELITLPASSLGLVKIDPSHFEQVLVNLVVNARDAMPNGGKLTIETGNVYLDTMYASLHAEVEAGEYVMLAISDNGVGMNAEVLDHIFEPFFTTKDVGKGTGLGLATCFGIIKQAGGHIWVYSEPGIGTTFKVYLPRIGQPESARSGRQFEHALPGGTETILLVEDETTVRNLAARVLRQRGYTVFEAENGTEALRFIHERGSQKVDLLLTDVIMPQMGGRVLVNQLKAQDKMPRVLFISGYTDNAIIQNDILAPEFDFLQKPFTPEQLALKVRSVLNKK